MDKATKASRILIVEDDPTSAKLLEELLATDEYHTEVAASGPEALGRARRGPPDLILLDVRMPDMDGFEVCRQLKADARTAAVPVLMVTALDNSRDKEEGLNAGADDYVTKPFGLAELRSRIRAVLRRSAPRQAGSQQLSIGGVTLDRVQREVTVRGETVRLTFSEFELLACLMAEPGRLFNRQELLRTIWGDSAFRDPRAIDVHIRHLREKLEVTPEHPRLILTVRGAGYRFAEV